MRFGVHVSIAGGIHQGLLRAVELGCDTAQFFLVNPRGWQSKPLKDEAIELFHQVRNREAKDIHPLIVHMPYLPNLASSDPQIFTQSISVLRDHLERCEALKIDFLVLHMGKGEPPSGIQRMVEGIQKAYGDRRYRVCLLFENTAGQGREIGSQIVDLSDIYNQMPKEIDKGICWDTCHAYAAGYDIGSKTGLRKAIFEFDQFIGFSEVKLLHINDSLKPLGSRVDRHEKIGEGFIGIEGFRTFFAHPRIQPLTSILEIPRINVKDDLLQLKLVRSLSIRERK